MNLSTFIIFVSFIFPKFLGNSFYRTLEIVVDRKSFVIIHSILYFILIFSNNLLKTDVISLFQVLPKIYVLKTSFSVLFFILITPSFSLYVCKCATLVYGAICVHSSKNEFIAVSLKIFISLSCTMHVFFHCEGL